MTTAFAARHSCAQYRALPYAATKVRRIRSKVIFTCFTSSGLAPYPGSLNLRRKLLIEDAGHWIQQERPDEVNAALIEFLNGLR